MEVEPIKSSFDWVYRLVKRAFPPGHPFLEDGDIQCNILIKQIKVSEEIEEFIQSADQFKCDTPGCAEWFSSIARYEAHYNSIHRNRCHTCHRSFPSLHLLDLHILENHDTLFQMIAVKKHMYSCLVESCPDKFSSEKDRKDHLVKLHKYPGDFRFNRKSRRQTKLKSAGAVTEVKQGTIECMDMCPSSSEVSSLESGKTSRQSRLPRTVCFGRGSARSFQREYTRKGKGKKKNKEKTQNHAICGTNEVTMDDAS